MAQPHKGRRVQINIGLPATLVRRIDVDAARHGMSRSQYLANEVCEHFGRTDLVLKTERDGELDLAVPPGHTAIAPSPVGPSAMDDAEQEIKLRIPGDVAEIIDRQRQGLRSRRHQVMRVVHELYGRNESGNDSREEPRLELPCSA